MSKQTIFTALPVIIISSLLTVDIIYSWREPTQTPPGGNIYTPINIGGTSQYKSGGLGIGGVFQTYGGTANPVLNVVGGNVGIGTTDPVALLEVSGQIMITGGSPGANRVLTSDASGLASWQQKGEVIIPSGFIAIYSGAWNFDITGLGTGILSGWALCNGRNGTPDLTNRFVMGTTTPQTLGATGGDSFFFLCPQQLPKHTHEIKPDGYHSHQTTLSDPENTWSFETGGIKLDYFWEGVRISTSVEGGHYHLGETNATGDGTLIDNRPAYIQLAFIMKL